MKTLVIRQPWAWSIIYAGKDIENRSWNTTFRGRFLVAAAKGMTQQEWANYDLFLRCNKIHLGIATPAMHVFQRGGIIGSVELVDVVDHSKSKWFEGPKGFVLRNPRALPFFPIKGRLGLFDVVTP